MPKFTKGMPSPNSSGRPKGNATAARLREAIAGQLPGIIEKLTEQALQGCTASAKLLLDRALPALKPQASAFTLDTIPTDTLATTGQLLIDSIMRGDVNPDTGAMLIGALSNQARIVEVTTLSDRLTALENGGSNG